MPKHEIPPPGPLQHWNGRTIVVLVGMALAWMAVAVQLFPQVGGWHAQDLSLYREAAQHVLRGDMPYRDFPFEYPPFALVPLVLPALMGGGFPEPPRFALAFLASNVLWGVLLALCVRRTAGHFMPPARALAATGMYAVLAFMGAALFPWRFDFFPAFLSALAILLVIERRPTAAGVSLGCAIAAKLYPLALLPVIAARFAAGRDRQDAIRFAVATSVTTAAIVAPFAFAAGSSTFSFLRYHQLRGLQVESVPAGLLMLGRAAGLGALEVVENFGAYHVATPATATVERILVPTFVAAIVAVGLLAFLRFQRERNSVGSPRAATLVGYVIVSLLVFMLSNKVLSPQYVIWLLPFAPLVALRQYALAAAAVVLTIVIFPFGYSSLVRLELPAVLLLNFRNLTLVGLTAWLLWDLRPSRS